MSTTTPPRRRTAPIDERFRERRRAVQRARVRRRRRFTLTALTLVLLAAVGITVARSPLFAIAEIRVVGTDRAAEVVEASGLAIGDNLLGADLDAATDTVTRLGWVRSADASRLPPSVVQIQVVTREPIAVVRLEDTSWLLDADAVVLAGGTDEALPIIEAPASVLPGIGVGATDAAIGNALAVHAGLPPDLRARVVRYEAGSVHGLRLRLAGTDGGEGVWVRIGTAERIDAKARVIQVLLGQVRDQARRQGGAEGDPAVAELDVRAPDNPVLVPIRR